MEHDILTRKLLQQLPQNYYNRQIKVILRITPRTRSNMQAKSPTSQMRILETFLRKTNHPGEATKMAVLAQCHAGHPSWTTQKI